MPFSTELSPPLLGPFRLPDGEEIIPATTEATDAIVEMVLGTYRVRSNLMILSGMNLRISPTTLTAFIQRDLERVFTDQPPGKGFLIAYQGSRAAIGRMTEDLIATRLLRHIRWNKERPALILSVAEAQANGWIARPRQGARSDDLVARTKEGHLWLVEVKGSLRGRNYLDRSRHKAVSQIQATLLANPVLRMAALIMISVPDKTVDVDAKPRGGWLIHEIL